MVLRAVIYARYSSELQNPTSIEDQVARCRDTAGHHGYDVSRVFSDYETSARSIGPRVEYQKMLAEARQRRFNAVIAESIDRLGRRTADVTDLHDRLSHLGIKLITVQYGEIDALKATVMGMIAQQFSRDLADKTRRGQEGGTRRGRVTAGLAYGYEPVDADGLNRRIVPEQAEIIRQIFTQFADGVAPNEIARRLNEAGVPGPRGGAWSGTTIRGHAARQTGILHNRAYIGEISYGRTTFSTDPDTGRRTSRLCDEPIVVQVPELRLINRTLWERVQARHKQVSHRMALDRETGQPLNRAHRRRFLLSGLLHCGCCGGAYAIMAKNRYGCSTRKNKGTCTNTVTITREVVEKRVLRAIRRGLLDPELVQRFVSNATRELTERRRAAATDETRLRKQLADLDRKLARLLDQMENDDDPDSLIGVRLKQRKAERDDVAAKLRLIESETPTVATLPNFAEAYAAQVRRLGDVLRDPDYIERAQEALRKLIDKVVLIPDATADDGMRINLHGEMARILATCVAASGISVPDELFSCPESQLSVVAGVGFEPTTFRL